MFKSLLVFLTVLLLSFGGVLFAEDDFGDDSFDDSSDDSSGDDGFGDEEDKKDSDDSFDAEKSAKDKEDEDKKSSDDAMSDLLGGDEEDNVNKEDSEDQADKEEEAPLEEAPLEETPEEVTKPAVAKGFKPVMMIKGGFLMFGQYKTRDATHPKGASHNMMFGAVDQGIVGLSFDGRYVVAKATMNLRTPNALTETKVATPVQTNPWIAANYANYDSNFYNWLHEVYGGVNFFGKLNQKLIIRAGKMLPTYGLVDQFDSLGAGIGTPYGTRDLSVTEGYIPESDAGWALGFDWAIKNKHHILFDFMMGSGTVGDSTSNPYWFSSNTMGLYIRAGYASKFLRIVGSLQSRAQQVTAGSTGAEQIKNVPILGFGVAAKLQNIHGFNMTFSFDYNVLTLVKTFTTTPLTTSTSNMLIHMLPSYDISIKKPWLDTLQISLRFDIIKGGYEYGTEMRNAYYFAYYTEKNMYFRIGAAVNWYVMEIKGVRSFAG
ncbi:MAG: hypothetical protein DRP58_12640, partial [Spirochaetes bacterium]